MCKVIAGDFGVCIIRLDYNSLTRFESSVFKPLLEGMSSGSIYVYNSTYFVSE